MSLGFAYALGLGLVLGDRDSIVSWLCRARIRPVVAMLDGMEWFLGGPLLGRIGVGAGVVTAATGADAVVVDATVFLVPPGFGVLPSSLHSAQARMTSLTVSLMRLQWYFSAMVAVVLLIPPWCMTCTLRAISYCRAGSEMTSLSLSMSLSPSSSL